MLLWYFGYLLLLANTTSAFAVTTTTVFLPSLTLPPRDAITSSTAAIEFITTELINIAGVTNAHVTIAEKTITIAIPTCIQTITPDKSGYVPPGTCNAMYDYYPSFTAAIMFSVAFGVLTVAHTAQAAIYRKSFCWVLIMGSLWEFISFAARSISTRYQQNVGLVLVSELFVLIAPLWINAFAYMLLARIIHFYHPRRSIFSIPASFFALIFVLLDIISFIVQIVGGSYAGPTAPEEQQMKGVHIYMGGIGLQQVFICIFLGLTIKFHVEMSGVKRVGGGNGRVGWERLIYTLYASLGFISIRIIFRLSEFSGGKTATNPLPFHEVYFYVLEAVPMLLAILIFNITHPGSLLVGYESEMPGLKETFWAKTGNRVAMKGDDGLELKGKYASLASTFRHGHGT